jgi:hypothetical protein
MTSRQSRLQLEFYSYAQLAAMWHCRVKTIQNWVCRERREGRPVHGFYRVVDRLRREFLIRGDSAEALRCRYRRLRVK